MAGIGAGFGAHTNGSDGEERTDQTPDDTCAPLHVSLVYREVGARVLRLVRSQRMLPPVLVMLIHAET